MDKKPNPIIDLIGIAIAAWLMFSGGIALPFVDPPPFKADKLCVLVVEETGDREAYTAGQREAMTAVDGPSSIRGYVAGKKGEFLLWDKDQPPTEHSPKWVAEALKVRGEKLPWILAATPSAGFSRELPADAGETIAALKNIGGP